MFNKIIMIGNLTRDIELKYFPSGQGCVASCGLAVNRKFKKQDGTQGEEVCFVDFQVFGRTAEVVNQYLRKGSKILIEGRLIFQQWEQNGVKHSKHLINGESIKMLDSAPQAQGYQQQAYEQQVNPQVQRYAQAQQMQGVNLAPQQPAPVTPNIPNLEIADDEIPF